MKYMYTYMLGQGVLATLYASFWYFGLGLTQIYCIRVCMKDVSSTLSFSHTYTCIDQIDITGTGSV